MNNIRCYDIDGNIIDTFYQWDKNQKIIIPIDSFNYDANIIAPKIHFTNDKMSNALPVQSVIEEGNIIADVPNILLETNLPINIFFYFSSHKNLSSQRTIASTIIPVRKKNKPDNYEYEENLTEYTFEDLVQNMLDTNNKYNYLDTEKANKTDISVPYKFRGSCTFTSLPTSGNQVNDTFYVTDKKCKYSWNGTNWYQSSLNETDYLDEFSAFKIEVNNKISELKAEIDNLKK